MHLDSSLKTVSAFAPPGQFESIKQHIDPAWVAEALAATGTATVRKRRLPGEQVVWGVIGMAMFRKWPIADLVGKLNLVLPGPRATVVPSAVAEARARVGAEPLEKIFEMSAEKWGHDSARKHAWRGLAIYGVDGSTLRVADSAENRAYFGGTHGDRGDSGYPLVRIAALMASRSHILVAAEFGPYDDSEITLSAFLWRAVPDNALVMVDRGFLAAGILVPLVRDGKRSPLADAREVDHEVAGRKAPREERRPGRVDSVARGPQAGPQSASDLSGTRDRLPGEGISPADRAYSMLDREAFPAAEMAAIYHERWEIELGYGEIKTDMLDRLESIRCRTVAAVQQELWGILLAYNLIRLEMERTADDFGVEPARISFVTSLRIICDTWSWCALASPGALPTRLKTMREIFTSLVLPERRTARRYPRALKIKMSKFPRKRSSNA
jgi:hypothetical protein